MTDDEIKQMIRVASAILMDAVLDIIQRDSHQWSNRPCESCRAISGIIGRPFGCYEYQRQRNARKTSMETT